MGVPTEAQRNEEGNQTKYHRVSKWCVAAQKPQVSAMRVLSPQNRGITAFAMIFYIGKSVNGKPTVSKTVTGSSSLSTPAIYGNVPKLVKGAVC